MEANEFVYELQLLAPSLDAIKKLGFPENVALEMKKSYECVPSKKQEKLNFIKNPLIDLVSNYDCSKVQIGNVYFAKRLFTLPNYYVIGEFEIDKLSINKTTYEVEVLDYQNLEWVIWSCAANGSLFLEALLTCAEYFNKTINDPLLAQNVDYTYKYVIDSSNRAGGDKYGEFYKVLLGYGI